MKRRKFILQTGLAMSGIAATGLGSAHLHAANAPIPLAQNSSRNIKKSLKWGMVKTEGSVLEKFQLLKDLGYDGVELDSPNDLDNNEVLEARDKTGLEIPGVVNSMHWKYPLSHPDPKIRKTCVDSMTEALEDCKLYGGTTVLLVPGVVNEDISYVDAWRRSPHRD